MSRSNRPTVNVPLPPDQDLSSQEEDQLIQETAKHMKSFEGHALVKLQMPDYSKCKVNMPNGLRSHAAEVQEMSRVVNGMSTAPLETLPVIKSISELIQDMSHLGDNPDTGQPNCAVAFTKFGTEMLERGHSVSFEPPVSVPEVKMDSSEAPANVNTDDIAEMIRERARRHLQAANFDPWQTHEFQQLIDNFPVPTYFFRHNMDQDNLYEMLRSRQVRLPLMPASLESELLRESGNWPYQYRRTDGVVEEKVYNFPPCSLAQRSRCIAQSSFLMSTLDGLDAPMVPVSLMFVEEWKHFLRTGYPVESGQSWQPRPCILCCRAMLVDWVMFLRVNSMFGFPTHKQSGFEWRTDQVMQFYRNLKGGQDGYAEQFMLDPQPSFKESIIESVVKVNAALLKCRKDSKGRRFIDQSALLWKGPSVPTPHVGEPVSIF